VLAEIKLSYDAENNTAVASADSNKLTAITTVSALLCYTVITRE